MAPLMEGARQHVSRPIIIRTLARGIINVLGMFLIYNLLPLEEDMGGRGIGLLVLGLVLFVLLLSNEVRSILIVDAPVLRAIKALTVSIPLFLLTFASTYVLMSHNVPGSFARPLSRIDSFYFTVTTFATVGFGDITPLSEGARVLVTIQMLCDLIVLGAVLKLVLGAVRVNRGRNGWREPAPVVTTAEAATDETATEGAAARSGPPPPRDAGGV